jgi:PAS domain-containing protein
MSKIQEMNDCGRAEQLVTYLYGESGAKERAEFEGHLAACAGCRAELSAFGHVREAVGTWRAELLTNAPTVATEDVIPSMTSARANAHDTALGAFATHEAATQRRTAWDALREFFSHSPAWLRFGSVAAALVICAFAALAVVNARVSYANGSFAFSTGLSRTSEVKQSAPQVESVNAGDGQLGQLVAERDAAMRELQDARAQLDDSRAANLDAVYREIDDSQPEDSSAASPTTSSPANAAQKRRATGATRKPSRRSQQNEDDLPRLIDLLSSGN